MARNEIFGTFDKVKYCEAGHAFGIKGIMAVGNTITVTVIPNDGYEFVRWSDGDTSNPREIYIDECGITYYGIFRDNCGEECNKREIYVRMVGIIGSNDADEYVETSITCEEIDQRLRAIIGND